MNGIIPDDEPMSLTLAPNSRTALQLRPIPPAIAPNQQASFQEAKIPFLESWTSPT